jgi:Domain of unknown function (DUF1937)
MEPYWFLGTPYSKYPGGLEEAFLLAIRARGLLMQYGIPCYSPIVHSHPVAKECVIDPRDLDIWLPAEMPMRKNAYGLIVLMAESWDISVGLKTEIDEFETANKPVRYMKPGEVTPELLDCLTFQQPETNPEPAIEPVPERVQAKMFNLAYADIGDCLKRMSMFMERGFRLDDDGHRLLISQTLERAATHVRGEHHVPVVDPKHLNNKKGS